MTSKSTHSTSEDEQRKGPKTIFMYVPKAGCNPQAGFCASLVLVCIQDARMTFPFTPPIIYARTKKFNLLHTLKNRKFRLEIQD
jgi:hypothetical protein